VKICGITRLEDAQLASSLGAWAVGFIFWPGSPRFIDPDAWIHASIYERTDKDPAYQPVNVPPQRNVEPCS